MRNTGELLAQEESRFTHDGSDPIWEVSSVIPNYILIKQANINLLPGAKRRVEGRRSLFFLSVYITNKKWELI